MTENNVAAQAGDEPMLTDDQVGNGVRAFVNAGKRGEDLGGAIRAAIVEALACRVSPRATADVELREAVGKLIKAKGRFHTEQNYAAVVAAYDATTKPGA